MTSRDVVGVNGGEICDWECDRVDMAPREEDWRLCPSPPVRDRVGDLCMYNGATRALVRWSMFSSSSM